MKETLWTIQNEAAFDVFQKLGVLRANPSHLLFDGEFQNAYDWMTSPIPVWAWYQWEGKRKRRDLRQSGYAKKRNAYGADHI